MRPNHSLPLIVLLLLTACGGGASSQTTLDGSSADTTLGTVSDVTSTSVVTTETTTQTSTPTTTSPATSTTQDPASLLESLSPECLAALETFVIAIEDVVVDYDYDAARLFEFEDLTIGLIPPFTAFAGALQTAGCATDEGPITGDAYPALIAFAQQNAPGSVGYLQIQAEMQSLPVGESCSEYIEIVTEYVARGGTVADLTRAERFHVFGLIGSINAWCPLQTAGAFTTTSEMQAYLETELN
ncbi:MAG TPA: hypothetical protein VI141_02525 [Acidimicrobiia bacterium]